MIEYFNTHLYAFWYVTGFTLLALELLVLGLSTGFVLFLGIAALLTGGLISLDLIPQTWLASIACFAISSIAISAALWRPFKNLETKTSIAEKDNSSDLVGFEFRLESDLSTQQPITKRYSGITWSVEIDLNCNQKTIPAGTAVKVTSVEVGKFFVIPSDQS